MMSRLINRLRGRVYGWFDSKDSEPRVVRPARFARNAVIALQNLEERSVPATFTVLNTLDSGAGSLRAAMQATVDTPGADTIVFNTDPGLGTDFDAGLNVISLLTALPTSPNTAGQDLSIVGPGADKLVIARGTSGVLNRPITLGGIFATPLTHSISDLTITGFSGTNSGGAIFVSSRATVTLTRVNITGNTGGTGAAIYVNNNGTLNIDSSTISGNVSSSTGGAIKFFGTTYATTNKLNITNSTLSGNTATSGGAISMASGAATVNIANSTITANSATTTAVTASLGGGAFSRGTTTTAQTITISSSIIAGNFATNGKTDFGTSTGTTYVFNDNLLGDVTPITFTGSNNTTAVTNPKLSLLGYQGGTTPVHVPLGGASPSQAIGAGTNSLSGLDQTGATRVAPFDRGSVESLGDTPFATVPGRKISDPLQLNLPNILTEVGAPNPYVFEAAFYDDDGVSAASVDGNEFLVTGPNGFSTFATLVAGQTLVDGETITANFEFTAPGGTWEGSDSGFYSISLAAGGAKDINSVPVNAGFEGAFYVGLPQPTAGGFSSPGVLTNPQTDVTFNVTFTDIAGGAGISFASLGNTNIRVTGSGFPANTFATFVSSNLGSGVDGTPLIATYKITGPGGSFDTAEDGQAYTLTLDPNQVKNTVGTSVSGGFVGSFVVSFPQIITVDTDIDVVNAGDGLTSLREAIIAANVGPDSADTILFSPTFFTSAKTITLSGTALPTVNGSVTINNASGQPITITKPSTVTGNLLAFNRAGGSATVNVSNISLLGTTAFGAFSALDISDETVTLTGVTISGATGTSAGQGIGGTLPNLTLVNSTVSNNSTTGLGAGISLGVTGSTLTLTNSVINGNSTTGSSGGGVRVVGGTVTVTGSSITNNVVSSTAGLGGGFSVGAGSLMVIDKSTIDGNSSGGSGGGISMNTGAGQGLYITNSTISRNTASSTTSTSGGGGILVGGTLGHVGSGKAFLVRNSTIAGNSAAQSGGGILFNGSINGTADILNTTIANNTASSNSTALGTGGGGIAISSASTTIATNLNIFSTILSGNTASGAANNADDGSIGTGALVNVTTDYNAIADQDDLVNNGSGVFNFGANNLLPADSTYNALKLTTPSVSAPFGLFLNNGGTTKTIALGAGTTAKDKGTNPATPTAALTTDQTGSPRVQPVSPPGTIDIGAFERIPGVPTATGGTLVNVLVNDGSTNPYFFEVTYADDTAIQKASVTSGTDVIIRTKAGAVFYANAAFVSTTATGDDPTITAKYSVTPPGDGVWDATDNNTYEVFFNGSVLNGDGAAVPATGLGTFNVAIGQTFTVDTALDVVDSGDGFTSLREAVTAANTNIAGSADIIKFSPTVFNAGPTITLSTFIAITDNLTIDASDLTKNVTVSGGGVNRVFDINNSQAGLANAAKVNLTKITVTGGSTTTVGGGIVNQDEIVTLTDCVISGNTTTANGGGLAGVAPGNTFNLLRTVVSGNSANANSGGIATGSGGGILNVTDSTISGNRANDGGGIGGAYATFTITGSTISGNIAASGNGGALRMYRNNVTISNSTFSGNSASGIGGALNFAAVNTGTKLNVRNSTITNNTAGGNGGGVGRSVTTAFTAGNVVFESTIIAGNVNAATPEFHFATNAVAIDGNNNLIGAADVGNVSFTGTGNLTGALAAPLNPLLAPLANNGGLTQTHALIPNGPGVDTGSNIVPLATDQRGAGFSRTENALADIGAFERVQGFPVAYNATPYAPITVADSNPYTFTITYANESNINISTLSTPHVLVTGPNSYSKVATLFGTPSPNNNDKTVVVTYQVAAPVGGWTGLGFNPYTVSVTGGVVASENSKTVPATTVGTFLAQLDSTFVVLNTNNSGPNSLRQAILDANALPNTNDTIIFGGDFLDGTIPDTITLTSEIAVSGSVIIDGNTTKDNLIISGNSTNRLFNVNNAVAGNNITFELRDLTLTGGSVAGAGGAILSQDENITLTRVTATGNKSSTTGGGVIGVTLPNTTTITVTDSLLTGNSATTVASGDGGAVRMSAPTSGTLGYLVVRNSTVSNNSAMDDGGAFNLLSGNSLLVENSTLSGNATGGAGSTSTTPDGGAIYFIGNVGANGFNISNSTISGNTAGAGGGNTTSVSSALSLPLVNGTFTVRNSTIVNNAANSTSSDAFDGGGGIAISNASGGNGNLVLESTIVAGNTSLNNHPDISAQNPIEVNFSAIGSEGNGLGFTLTGTSNNNLNYGIDLKYGPLQDNGAGVATHLPDADSPLVDRGSNIAPALTTDQRGFGIDSVNYPRSKGVTDIGAVERGFTTAGFASVNGLVDITAAGTTPYFFDVVYTDNDGISKASINNGDAIRVTGPNGFDTIATLKATLPANGSPLTATYSITAPGGSWGGVENGTYTVELLGSKVSDVLNNFIVAQTLGSFDVVVGPFIVTNTKDSGSGSLREAIAFANSSPDISTVTFSSLFDTPQTITLTSGELLISENVTITGNGANLTTVSGNNSSRVFKVANTGSVLDVTITDLKVTAGFAAGGGTTTRGGGIDITAESVTLNRMWVTGNTSSGVGGGISNSVNGGNLTLLNSTVDNNVSQTGDTTYGGGGILTNLGGAIVIRNSTIANNTANNAVGGTAALGGGLLFYSATGSVTIENTTIVGNSAVTSGGGIRFFSGTYPVTITNSIIASNTANASADFIVSGSMAIDVINSAFGSSSFTSGPNTANNIGTTNLALGTLQNNGGTTPTISIDSTSDAYNAGTDTTTLSFDQRGTGFPRLVSSKVDMGAFEVQAATAPVVTGFIVNGNASPNTQRSRLTTVTVNFASAVDLTQFQTLDAVYFTRTGIATNNVEPNGTKVNTGNGLIVTPASGSGNSITLTFQNIDNAGIDNGSLSDGRWQLSIPAASYNSPNTPADIQLRRLFGDIDNNGSVDAVDFSAFPPFSSIVGNPFDFDNNDTIDGNDFAAFGGRNGYSLI